LRASELEEKVALEFSEDELRFLEWAMRFLEGGPFDSEKEKQRDKTAFKFRKALTDYEHGIVHSVDNSLFYIECAYCEGSGVFPDILPNDDIETEPCPVCKGRGFNTFKTTLDNVLKCRFCGGDGKAWDSSGYATGDVCQVCNGMGLVLLEQLTDIPKNEYWDLLHPGITRISRSRFESGHYADAVEAAFKEINKTVKEIVKSDTGEELDGAPLMYKAFSINQPIICIGDLSAESGRNIQQGYMQIYAGAMIGIRNPKAHENVEIDGSRASHLLTLASLLMYKLDERT
jgi:uncharacterized protein (TIGR02391 family)